MIRTALRSASTVGALLVFLLPISVSAQVTLDDGDEMLFIHLPAILSGNSGTGPVVDPNDPALQGDENGVLTVRRTDDRLTVTSSQIPTWRLEFAIGSGAPGGGTAIGLYIPASSEDSVVEPRPFRMCCSGLGLDNLEWRHRPFGGTAGVRRDLGSSSTVQSFRIIRRTPKRIDFELRGSWDGVSSFTRTTQITPDGFNTVISANYNGETGRESMWWLMSLFNEDSLDSDKVTIEDGNSDARGLRKTLAGTPLPSDISFPYTINYPLSKLSHTISLTMKRLADTSGASRFYEYFDNGSAHGIGIGPYYLIYPRWTSVFQRKEYTFSYGWKFSK